MPFKRELKRGFAKKSLARIITNTALLIGSIGIAGLTGCQSYPYSTMENQVYNYVNKFSKKIPKGFVKKDNFYHDNSLVFENKNEYYPKSGKGRIVINISEPNSLDTIVAGYIDANELKSFGSTEDPNELKSNIIFGRAEGKFNAYNLLDEILILNKGKDFVLYIKKDDQWKIGVCELLDVKCYEGLMKNGEIVIEGQVKRYIDLANKFEETYFKKKKEE